jgi:hypothetical protein
MKMQDIISILGEGFIESTLTYFSYTVEQVQYIIDTFSFKNKSKAQAQNQN